LGASGVTFFFVLSGFIMAYTYRDKFQSLDGNELKSFYIKRLSKVYPLHVLTFLISIPLMYATNFETNFPSALLNVFLMQSYFPIGGQIFAFNALSWFLSDIVIFYLATPFLIFGLHKIRARENTTLLWTTLILVFIGETSLAYMVKDHMEMYSVGWWFIYISPWARIFDYAAGLISGLIFVSIQKNPQTNASRVGYSFLEIAALVIFAAAVYSYRYLPFRSFKIGTYYIPFSIFLIFIYSFQKGWISWLLSRNILVHLGGLSFTFYMCHQLMITYTTVFFTSTILYFEPSVWRLMPQFLILLNVILISEVVFRSFEEPMRRKILSKFHLD
jgi:peptidoglycan/LPS O-acetylase OafA/YrhL